MMPYIIILKVSKFHQPTANHFGTARQNPLGGAQCPPPSLNRLNPITWAFKYTQDLRGGGVLYPPPNSLVFTLEA